MPLSPLRYPGGKTRGSKILVEFIPEEVERVVSPFFGGGSFENYLAQRGREVIGYDYCEPLVCFWQAYLRDSDAVFTALRELASDLLQERFWGDISKEVREIQRQLFFGWRDKAINDPDPFIRGVHYFALNRGAFSGMTLIGGPMSTKWIDTKMGEKPITNMEKIDFRVKSVDHMSCFESIDKHKDDFLYLDPPYIMESEEKEAIYGLKGDLHAGFDHQALADLLIKHKNKWVLSYLNVPRVYDLYDGFNIREVTWTYSMKPGTSRPSGRELVITNF